MVIKPELGLAGTYLRYSAGADDVLHIPLYLVAFCDTPVHVTCEALRTGTCLSLLTSAVTASSVRLSSITSLLRALNAAASANYSD